MKSNAKKSLQLGLELKSVYSQMNPHFIFNSLGVAMYLVKKKRLDDAYNHIYKFAHLLRAYIKSSRNRYITLHEEVTNISNYIELQQERFKDRFDYEIIVQDIVDANTRIPSLLLQPLVENAINHGLLHKDTRGCLKIEFKTDQEHNELTCIIDDDGVGRKLARQFMDENRLITEEAYGSELIRDLCAVFNKYEQMKINIETIDKEQPLTGTIVILNFKIPAHENNV